MILHCVIFLCMSDYQVDRNLFVLQLSTEVELLLVVTDFGWLWYGVVATTAPRVASADALHGKP